MEFESVPADVLDLLFDNSCDLLKDDIPVVTKKRDALGPDYTEQDSGFHNISFVSIIVVLRRY